MPVRIKTRIGIVGAGPAGLLLSHLLHLEGIENVVVENRSRRYAEERVRAGVLEQGTVDLLCGSGIGERLRREGLIHHGVELRFEGRGHGIDMHELTPLDHGIRAKRVDQGSGGRTHLRRRANRVRSRGRRHSGFRYGPILQKGMTAMRSFVVEPMQYGRLFLAGDAAHIVPATGAKGLNLAAADVAVLARALAHFSKTADCGLLDSYSETCLRRVWRVQQFS